MASGMPMGRYAEPALTLSIALWWVLVLGVLRCGVAAPLDDTWEYALTARRLAAGEGFRTTALPPPLWSLRDGHGGVPLLVHGPMIPLLLAPFSRSAPDLPVRLLPWLAALCAALASWTLYRAVSRTRNPEIAAAAALWITLSPLTTFAVLRDPSFAIGAFWLVLAIERLAAGRAFFSGLALGAGALVRPECALLAPLLVALVPRGRWWWLGGFALLEAPWLVHLSLASGAPAFNLSSYLLLSFTRAWPELSILRSFDVSIGRWPSTLVAGLPALPEKWLHALPRAGKHLLSAPAFATGWLSAIGTARVLAARTPALPLGPGLVLLAALPLSLMVAVQHRPEFVMTVLPVWALLAAIGLDAALARAGWRRPGAVVTVALLLAAPEALWTLRAQTLDARTRAAWLARDRESLEARFGTAASAEPGRRFIVSDTPGYVSWVTGRTALWLYPDELNALYAASREGRTRLPEGFPSDRRALDTWFHADPRRPSPGSADARE